MNQVILIGRTTKDVDLKYINSGKAVANVTIAVNRKFKKDEADFINCTAWDKTAELLAEYVKKGNRIAVQGSLRVSSYEKDGQKRYKTDVNIEQLQFLESKKSNVGNLEGEKITDDDDLPW